jgi:hypothetical protein
MRNTLRQRAKKKLRKPEKSATKKTRATKKHAQPKTLGATKCTKEMWVSESRLD